MLKDAAGSSTATFDLVMDGVLKLHAQVPERFVGQVQPGQKAEIHVDAYPDRVFAGEVFRINPMIDRNSRTFEVEIVVDNPKRELKAGGFAKVDILTHVDTAGLDRTRRSTGHLRRVDPSVRRARRKGPCRDGRHRRGRPRLAGTGRLRQDRTASRRPGHHQRPGQAGRGRRRTCEKCELVSCNCG